MDQGLKEQELPWCLYLPGYCIHASAFPGTEDELHFERDKIQLSVTFLRFQPPTSNEPSPGQHPAFRPSPWQEFPAEQESASQRPSRYSLLPRNSLQHPTQLPVSPQQRPLEFKDSPLLQSFPLLTMHSSPPTPAPREPTLAEIAKLMSAAKAFENTSTSVAASQMRNALNNLADTVTDPEQKKVG